MVLAFMGAGGGGLRGGPAGADNSVPTGSKLTGMLLIVALLAAFFLFLYFFG